MRIGRTLPPASAPLGPGDIFSGLKGILQGTEATSHLSRDFRMSFGVKDCFLVSSGKAALALILTTLKELIPGRTDVLIPAFTCYSVPSAIVRAGLQVRYCDIDPMTMDFDEGHLAAELQNPRLLSVIPTHLFGIPVDVEGLRKKIEGREIFIVEDAAQAMGGEWKGKKLGTQGDVGFFSLGRGKALSTVSGGVILTDHLDLAGRLRKKMEEIPSGGVGEVLRTIIHGLGLAFGSRPNFFWLPKSLPFLGIGETRFDSGFPIRRMNAFQTGMARRWKEHLGEFRMARLRNARKIINAGAFPILPVLENRPLPDLIRLPILASGAAERRALLARSERRGLGMAAVYPGPVGDIPELRKDTPHGSRSCPGARTLSERLFTIPIHPLLADRDLDRIISFPMS